MNPKIKARWVKALRSGKYKQGRGKLRTAANQYCCLGVLCDLYSKATGDKWKKGINFYLSDESNFLPATVSTWAGIKGQYPENPRVDFKDKRGDIQRLTLSDCNDEYKLSLKKIATLIERSL